MNTVWSEERSKLKCVRDRLGALFRDGFMTCDGALKDTEFVDEPDKIKNGEGYSISKEEHIHIA